MKKSTKIITGVIAAVAITTGSIAIAGKGFRGNHAEHADYAVGFLAKKLDLDETQKQALDALKDQMLVARETMHGQMETTKDDARALIESDTFDQAKALEMVTTKTATVNSVAPELVGALGNFLDTLDAEQKAEILEFMDSRKGRGKRGGWRH